MSQELAEPLAFPFPLLAALSMAAVHALGGAWHGPRVGSRRVWLSAAGGISVAYVFVQLLPELAAVQNEVDAQAGGLWLDLEDHAYLLAVAGLALFYGVEGRVEVVEPPDLS